MTLININNTLIEAEVIVDQKTINDETILQIRKNGSGAPKHHIFVKTPYYPILKKYFPNLFNTVGQPQTGVKEIVKNYFKISSLINEVERINSVIDINKEQPINKATLLNQLKSLAVSQGLVTEFYLQSDLSYANNGLGFKNWQLQGGTSFGTDILKFFFHKTQLKVYIFDNSTENSAFWEIDESLVESSITAISGASVLRNDEPAKQIIYFGAPGTGKSYKVAEVLKGKELTTQRVTFFPDYDYSSFIGGYKPKQDDNDNIVYGFVPPIFTNMYVQAWLNPEKHYYLVIEEINRGNCAEIFGDVFQLLDRNQDYKVSPSNELKIYLSEAMGFDHEGLINGLVLPFNLSILATMNTSDQSLYPMDSAFKRRWDWEYVPIDYIKNDDNKSSAFIIKVDDDFSVNWIDFIEVINKNNIMDNPNLGMDKCIGNYFIKPKSGNEIQIKDFINKVIFYLWNDVFKDEDNTVFADKTSYESFFPVETNGVEHVKLLMQRIGLVGNS